MTKRQPLQLLKFKVKTNQFYEQLETGYETQKNGYEPNDQIYGTQKNEKKNDEKTCYVQHYLQHHEYEHLVSYINEREAYGIGHFEMMKKRKKQRQK
jgi:hypothetical protein